MDMEQEQMPQRPAAEASSAVAGKHKKRGCGCLSVLAVALLAIVAAWFLVRPGVFTVQPIGAIPEGVTFIYHSRSPEMPFFSSPDGLCLEIQGSVSLLCRGAALAGASDLTDRIIIKLPYSHWAYLLSTGGLEFDR
jgi:hypothetical protein